VRCLAFVLVGAALLAAPLHAQVPRRVAGMHADATKSCAEIERFVSAAAKKSDTLSGLGDFHCAGAHAVPAGAQLELTKTAWNGALRRWEFALRCASPEDCVPFLVWAGGDRNSSVAGASASSQSIWANAAANPGPQLVKAGQTATLTWDAGGIRIVAPVTCLDAGTLGQKVRIRFKNAVAILRAQVVGAGELQAGL